tara:strand:- start:6732 stop:8258 length:1527 start_codon:yes stop_codon:yes gene_type:complete
MNNEKKKQLLKTALQYHNSNNLESADKIYQEILNDDDLDFDANHLHGTVLSQNKRYAEAIKYFSNAYEKNTHTCELLNNYAIALRNLKAYTECEHMLIQAINLDKYFPNSYSNLSNCYLSQDRYDDAINILKKSIELDLNTLKSHHDIASILYSKLSRSSDNDFKNLEYHLDVLAKCDDKSVISSCALMYYNIGQLEKSLKLFKHSEKLYSDSLPTADTLRKISNKNIIKTFVSHEFEQIRHIDSDIDGIRNMKITQEFYDRLEDIYKKSPNQYIDEDYTFISNLHRIKYNKPPQVKKNYINESLNFEEIEKTYTSSNPEIVIIDNFLSHDFLNELRVFFRCSNIFKYPYSRGYIGTFLGKGMANKALLEFSTELKMSFQKIFQNYYLSQAWAFKYDAKKEGIGIHADDARVNVNFWITEDSANMNPKNGGMIVWKKTPKHDASFQDFNSLQSMNRMKDEIKDTDFVKVPYKSNRAVIFNSKLYHVTDEIHFKDYYKDRRVNVTFLYK